MQVFQSLDSLCFSLPWPLHRFHAMDTFHCKFIRSPFKLILFFIQIQSLLFIKGSTTLHSTRNLIYALPTKSSIFHSLPANWIYLSGHCEQGIVNTILFSATDERRSSAESFAAVWPVELDLQQALFLFALEEEVIITCSRPLLTLATS